MSHPAIVVSAYNRPRSLSRLLSSISNAHYPDSENIQLIISIDKSDNHETKAIADQFIWKHGPKEVIAHKSNLGLRNHIIFCGDLTQRYGGPIILLEDDLYVSPYFYQYTTEALTFFSSDQKIAGIALYNHTYNETAKMFFYKYDDAAFNYFLQIPCSWGQVWTLSQWGLFKNWYQKEVSSPTNSECILPSDVQLWPETSWKKYFYKYMIVNDLYFTYPRVSLSTNFGDEGTHHIEKSTLYQTILLDSEIIFQFHDLDQSTSIYDSFCELHPKLLNDLLDKKLDLEVDIYGSKILHEIKSKYLISAKNLKEGIVPIASWTRELKPPENNIKYNLKGSNIKLALTNDFLDSKASDIEEDLSYYYNIPKDYLDGLDGKNTLEEKAHFINSFHEYQQLKTKYSFKLYQLFFGN